jgi:UDP-N-acetyl-2-amino-2-deoxyglucuronate dehydrogenase
MNCLRAGVIGFGYTGQLHLQAWNQVGVPVTVVAENHENARAAVPGNVQTFANYLQVLESDVDVVSICVPTALHYRVTLDALAAGKHILLEKPIAPTVEEADAMIAAARHAGLYLLVGMTHRFYPEVLEARRIVQDGGIGEIVMIRDCILEHFGFLNSPPWYLQKNVAGGGTALTSGIHLIDRVLWFLEELPSWVAGSVSNRFFGQDVEDGAQISLGFASGRSAQITCGFLSQPHPLVCDLEVIGTGGSVIVHTWRGYEYHSPQKTESREVYTSQPHAEKVLVGLRAEAIELCDAIRSARQPRPSAEESTQALRVITAFYDAARTGATQPMEFRT